MGEAGFTLVEVFVALLVVAGMAGVLFGTLAANARFADDLRKRREAVMIARSLIDQATVVAGRDALSPAGRSGSFAWRVLRRKEDSGARDVAVPVEEVRIDVMEAGSGRLFATVRTLRLAR